MIIMMAGQAKTCTHHNSQITLTPQSVILQKRILNWVCNNESVNYFFSSFAIQATHKSFFTRDFKNSLFFVLFFNKLLQKLQRFQVVSTSAQYFKFAAYSQDYRWLRETSLVATNFLQTPIWSWPIRCKIQITTEIHFFVVFCLKLAYTTRTNTHIQNSVVRTNNVQPMDLLMQLTIYLTFLIWFELNWAEWGATSQCGWLLLVVCVWACMYWNFCFLFCLLTWLWYCFVLLI